MLTPELAGLYTEDGTALVSRDRTWATEIGDTKQPDFHPQVKLARWGNEVNFSVRLVSAETGLVSFDRSTVRWATPSGFEARFYDKGFTDGGGFEFEVWLASQPVSNVIEFSLRHKGLVFAQQGSLTTEEIAAGDRRPANVVGSYAVYHASRVNGVYRAGKAFHLYRPWARDAVGTRVWCDLFVDPAGNRLTITVPQAFLDAAVYPVLIDPTLGYTTVGGSAGTLANTLAYALSKYTMAEAGTATAVQIYTETNGSNITFAIYTDSSGVPNTTVSISAGGTLGGAASPEWKSRTITGSLSSGATYWPAAEQGNTVEMRYDTVTDIARYWVKVGSYTAGAMEFDPWGSGSSLWDRRVSIYLDYTASGGGGKLAGSLMMAGMGF